MSFRSPLVLILAVVLVPAALAALAYAARQRVEALRLFLGDRAESQRAALRPLVQRRQLRGLLLAGALAASVVALAGPRYGTSVREGRQESLDLLIALDVSNSMRAEDVAPSRLERAKLEIERVVEARRGDRVGLVVFAGEAFLQCPLTTDRGALRLFLDAAVPDQIAVQGTDFSSALAVAEQAFNAGGENARPRALLVVSDGEDHEGGLGDAADDLRDDGVTILALGVGTDEGAPIPDVRRGRSVGPRLDRSGETVVTRFEDGALVDLAGRDGLFRAERRPAAPALNSALDRLDRAVVRQDEVAASAERFQWPLGLALLLVLAERVLAVRRPRSAPTNGSATLATALIALALLSGCGLDAIQPGVREGRRGVALLEDGRRAAEQLADSLRSIQADLAPGEAPPPAVAEGLAVATGEAQKPFRDALSAFVAGLALPDVSRETRAKLWHGVGRARAPLGEHAAADSAFAQALALADSPRQRGRYAYDAGTVALLAGDGARADSLLRLALLLYPTPDARRNQEIARRLGQTPQPEPSDYAAEVKARADSLVAARQYREALNVMEEGLARDSSVAAYADFTQRLGGVVQIEESVPSP